MRGRRVPLLSVASGCEETLNERLLTGDDAPYITEGSPMPEGEHGERPPRYDRGSQDLPRY